MPASGYVSATGDPRKVSKTGDTMTGELELPDSSPDSPLAAASRGFVEEAVAEASGGVPSGTVTPQTDYGLGSAAGVSSQYSRGDHRHGTPAAPSVDSVVGLAQALELLAALTGADFTGPVTITEAGLTVVDGQVLVDSSGTAINAVDRGSTNNFAAYVYRTAGVDRWAWQMANDGTNDLLLTDSANGVLVLRVTPGTTPRVTFNAPVTFAGGSNATRTAKVKITNDDLSGLPEALAWTLVQTSSGTKLQCTIQAAVGDRIRLCPNFLYVGSHFLDWALLDSAGSPAQYATSESATPPPEGNPSMYPTLTISKMGASEMFTVGSGHLNAGMATIALAHQGGGTGSGNRVYAHPTYPFRLRLENIGPEPS